MSSPTNAQLNLPPVALPNRSPDGGVRTISSHEPEVLTALLFDEALRETKDLRGRPAPITTKEAAALLGVSESLVTRWRSPHHRETPSLVQFMRLPSNFHVAWLRAMNPRVGFGQQLLRRLLDDLSDLALVVER